MTEPTTIPRRRPKRATKLVGWVGVWIAASLLLGWEMGFALARWCASLGWLARLLEEWAATGWAVSAASVSAVSIAACIGVAVIAAVLGFARPRDRWVLLAWCGLGGSIGALCAAPEPPPEVFAHVGRTRYHLVTAQPLDGRTSRLLVWASWHEGEWRDWNPPVRARTRPRLPEATLLLSGTLDLPEPWSPGPPRDGWMRTRRAYHFDDSESRVVCGKAGERREWVRTCVEALGPVHGAVAAAALLGERRLLPKQLVTWFERTGTIHLLAISGFHVSLLGAIVWTAARILTRGARWSRWLALGGMIGYALFVGAPISVVRALSMAGLALVGSDCGRGVRIWNGWGWVTVLMTLSDPRQPLQTGFTLSISATAGVLLGARLASLVSTRLRRVRHRYLRPMAALGRALSPLVGTSLGATLLTTPWMLYVFANMYPLSLLANLVAIPAMAMLLPAMVAAVLTERGSLPGAEGWSASAMHIGDAFVTLLATLAQPCGQWVLSGSLARENAWAATLCAALLLIVVNRCFETGFRRSFADRINAGVALTALMALGLAGHAPLLTRRLPVEDVAVRFLSIGQGDAILIDAPYRRWLVDFGPGDWGGRDQLVPHLRRLGIDRIDRAWITHGDMDHWGGLISVLERGIRVDTLALSGAADFSDSFWRTVTEANPRPHVLRVVAPQSHSLGAGVEVEVLHPWMGVEAEDRNDASLVLVLSHRDAPQAKLVLIGDLEMPGLSRMVERGTLPRTLVLQAGHHGSRTSVHDEAYDRLDPKLVIASLGRNNRFDFPHVELTGELNRRGVPLLRTDVDGTIGVHLTEQGLQLTTKSRPWRTNSGDRQVRRREPFGTEIHATVDPPESGP